MTTKVSQKIILAQPRGFCAGVDRAVLMVERALELFGKPIYIRHEIVHNKYVVQNLQEKGAVFVENIHSIPPNSITIFSAHGVSQQVRQDAKGRNLKVFDATCPLVTKVHLEVHKFSREGRECILIGHAGHPEVEGTLGQYENSGEGNIYLVEDLEQANNLQVNNPQLLAYVTQTTLSIDDTANIIKVLKQRFPKIKEPYKDDICYATQNRQNAVKDLAKQCQLIIVIGSRNSSNSNRLSELSIREGTQAYLVDNEKELRREWLAEEGVENIGITAGASAPEKLVLDVINQLKEWGVGEVLQADGKKETVVFNLPADMRKMSSPQAEKIEINQI